MPLELNPDYVALNLLQGDGNDSFTEVRYRQMGHLLERSSGTVLDLGASNGKGGAVLKGIHPQWKLVALDCIRDRLDQVPKGVYDQVICGYSTQIPLPTEGVDAVVAGEFIEHLTALDFKYTFKEILRLLKPGGLLVLTSPNPGFILRKVFHLPVLGGAHLTQHTPSDLRQFCEENGLRVKSVLGSGRVSLILSSHFPHINLYGSYMLCAVKAASFYSKTSV